MGLIQQNILHIKLIGLVKKVIRIILNDETIKKNSDFVLRTQ